MLSVTPPYVGYNECSKQGVLIVKLIQEKKAQMSNIYGVNLNTVPGRIKAYAPKPNLYAFFAALGIALLKDNGKLCYIIPQTILTSGDLDVLRYHLAKFTTIEKIITFSGKMFIGRGLKQDKPVATSSLIFVLGRKIPSAVHEVEIINYKNPNDNIEVTLQNILAGEKISKKRILQTKLLQNIANWNFIKQNKNSINLLDFYNNESESMDIYRVYELSKDRFNDIFIIDGSYNIPTKNILNLKQEEKESYYEIPVPNLNKFVVDSFDYYPKSSKVKIAKGGQGLKVVNTKYKVLWRYVNPNKFYFVEGNNVLPRFLQFCIGSNNKQEILYLFILLNSRLNNFILDNYLKSENEKDILLGVKTIKEFIRVPKITNNNKTIKSEVIKRTEEMLLLEGKKLSDFVDFSEVLLQKFKGIRVEGNHLVLIDGDKKTKLKINGDPAIVENALAEQLGKSELPFELHKIKLSDLRNLPVIDSQRQTQLKEYIDDLVFALYFKIGLVKIGLEQAKMIQKTCMENRFYKIIHEL